MEKVERVIQKERKKMAYKVDFHFRVKHTVTRNVWVMFKIPAMAS